MIQNCEVLPIQDGEDDDWGYNQWTKAGGIYSEDILTLKENVRIEGCKGYRGGAICLDYMFLGNKNGSSIEGSVEIRGNSAPYGGGIYVESRGIEIADDVQIVGNTATYGGGGIYVAPIENDTWAPYSDSLVVLSGGTVSQNTAPRGGGIFVSSSESENFYDEDVYDEGYKPGKLALFGGAVTGNAAETAGGGIYQGYDATIFVTGTPKITGNKVGAVENNLCLGWNLVDNVTFDEFWAGFLAGKDCLASVYTRLIKNMIRGSVEEMSLEECAEIAEILGLEDMVIDGVYIGDKEQLIDAYAKIMVEPAIDEFYNTVFELGAEDAQKDALQSAYNNLTEDVQYLVAKLTVTAPLKETALIGITAEDDYVGRLVAEGGRYSAFNGTVGYEESHSVTDSDLSAFISDDPQYYIDYALNNKNQFVLAKRTTHTITVEVVHGTAQTKGLSEGMQNGDEITYTLEVEHGGDASIYFSPNDGFALDSVTVDGTITILNGKDTHTFYDVTDDHSIRVVYEEDNIGEPNGGDGIPDVYQVVVTYKVVGGVWSDKTTADVNVVFDLAVYDVETGEWVALNSALGDTIPTGMAPDAGHAAPGSWNIAIDGTTPVTQNVTYIYTFPDITPVLTVTPADITVYMGGDKGYEAVIGEDGQRVSTNSLPTPLFHVDLPGIIENAEMESIILTGDTGRTWKFELAGKDRNGNELYYINSIGDDNQEPVRMTYSIPESVKFNFS